MREPTDETTTRTLTRNSTTVQTSQDDTARDATCTVSQKATSQLITHARHSTPTPTFNPLLTIHVYVYLALSYKDYAPQH